MTTVITRLYADEETAERAQNRLRLEGLPKHAVEVISADGRKKNALSDRLEHAGVWDEAAKVYAGRIADGASLLVVRATYKPLGAAKLARGVLRETPAVDVGLDEEERFVPDGPERAPNILKDHPRFMTFPLEPDDYRPGTISDRIGVSLLTSWRPSGRKVFEGGRFMSRVFWPMPLTIRKKSTDSVIRGGKHVSKTFWPMPLVKTNPRRLSVIRGGGFPLSRAMGWPLLTR